MQLNLWVIKTSSLKLQQCHITDWLYLSMMFVLVFMTWTSTHLLIERKVNEMTRANFMTVEHTDAWVFEEENNKHFRYIRQFASRLLDVPYDDITVECFSQDEEGLYEATVTIPYGDGFTTEHIHEYHD